MALDPLSKAQRSERMSRIKSKNTKPEMVIRRYLYHSGFRYRLHVKELPGKPDLVFKGRKKVIFIHGCFWHQHGCKYYRMPHTKIEYWIPKLQRNVERDKNEIESLEKSGWNVLIIWECEIKHDLEKIKGKIYSYLVTNTEE